jgi:hypothetical protein
MEWIETESKPGHYDTFINEAGDKYVVLDGLSPAMVHTPSALESFMTTHYDFFALTYWGLLLVVFTYLIGSYLVIPAYVRIRRGLPLFVGSEDSL